MTDIASPTTLHSDWIVIDQPMIDGFAEFTLDRQFIHVDPSRAAKTPFGGTVAHGFLTLALLSHAYEAVAGAFAPPADMSVNYGFDRIRFISPVRSGSRVRAAFSLLEETHIQPGQVLHRYDVIMEIDGHAKPALAATWLVQFFREET